MTLHRDDLPDNLIFHTCIIPPLPGRLLCELKTPIKPLTRSTAKITGDSYQIW
jgi:hypothetical protein